MILNQYQIMRLLLQCLEKLPLIANVYTTNYTKQIVIPTIDKHKI